MIEFTLTGEAVGGGATRPDPADNAVAAPDSPDTEDVVRFESLLSRAGLSGGEELSPAAGGEITMGNAILENMQNFSRNRNLGLEKIHTMLDKCGQETLSAGELVKMQFEISKINLEQDVVAKSADKVSQGTQTLFRAQ